MQTQFYDEKPQERIPSISNLVLSILKSSFWVLSHCLKIILILHKEMFFHLIATSRKNFKRTGNGPNIFNHYGVWLIDLHGLIREQMEIK